MITPLRNIPGVGKQTQKDLEMLGFHSVEELKDADPEEMYKKECLIKGVHIDRCQLYVYRCAVAYAKSEGEEREKMRWWHFKDK